MSSLKFFYLEKCFWHAQKGRIHPSLLNKAYLIEVKYLLQTKCTFIYTHNLENIFINECKFLRFN